MRIVLLLSLFCIPAPNPAQAQTPANPPAAQTRPRSAARTAMVITVTDPTGATLPGIHVELSGDAERSGDTDDSGSLRFANLRAGTYRVRFSGPGVIAFEREVLVRAGQTADVDVTLNPAAEESEPEEEPTPPVPAAASPEVGPPGEPKTQSILTLLEKELIRREPRKETILGCSGNARSTLIQINEQQPERLYEGAEAIYYVIGGEGTLRLNGRERAITTSDYIQVPRGTSHALVRKGKRPLLVLAVLSGEPCQTQ
jgi:mannose-6-phosphate isomerase-like protein (cupin superfamily)